MTLLRKRTDEETAAIVEEYKTMASHATTRQIRVAWLSMAEALEADTLWETTLSPPRYRRS